MQNLNIEVDTFKTIIRPVATFLIMASEKWNFYYKHVPNSLELQYS